ncbi:MAG: hypothetical protein SF182_06095 [Deltaproteobacteria bacterium]|nr:hypothetical protein [Deltaproteobacteria bacterium]
MFWLRVALLGVCLAAAAPAIDAPSIQAPSLQAPSMKVPSLRAPSSDVPPPDLPRVERDDPSLVRTPVALGTSTPAPSGSPSAQRPAITVRPSRRRSDY